MPQLQSISPCFWFAHDAEAAARFYVSVFPDSRIDEIVRWPAFPGGAAPMPAGSVLTVRFTLAGQEFIALNGGGHAYAFSEALSLSVRCETQQEIDHHWAALSAGGSEGPCGWLKDRYGVSWQIVPSAMSAILAGPDSARAARAMMAMMPMQKIDIAAILAAAG